MYIYLSCEQVNNSHTDIHGIGVHTVQGGQQDFTFRTSKQGKAYNRQQTTHVILQIHTQHAVGSSSRATRANLRKCVIKMWI